jgi:hypothetical protein
MSLSGPKSMRKGDGSSPISTDFHVSALTPGFNYTWDLAAAENITLYAVCCIYTGVISKET